MIPRRQSPLSSGCETLSSGCENFAVGEFDALLATDYADHAPSEPLRADELLEWIEDSEIDVRFVPDWADESFRNAA
jgi:hypothetical protein